MSFRRRSAVRLGVALLAAGFLALGHPLPGSADQTEPRTYPDQAYSADFALPPSQPENQSKLWFHADAWWALLLEPTGRTVRVHELMPDHTWRPTSAVVNPDAENVGDALHDGDTVHVVSRSTDDSLLYVRLTFDPATRDYRAHPPRLVTDQGSQSPPTIAEDGTGRLWVAFAPMGRIVVTYSDSGGQEWSRNIPIAMRDAAVTDETAAIVAFDDRVGILWSNQAAGSFEFATHRDGDDPRVWAHEIALIGPAQADNHISLKRVPGDPSDTLVAAVKTSRGDQAEPVDSLLLEMLVRTPDGRWSSVPVSTIADGLNEPIIQVDTATRTLHLFAARGGSIVTKRTALDDIRFEPGIGDLAVLGAEGGLVHPTGSKDPVNSRSGLVVLASDALNRTYRHLEMPIASPASAADPGDQSPPSPPAYLQARALSPDSVVLSWAKASDGNRWAPGRDGVPVREYVLLRNGAEVASVASTSFRDQPREGPDLSTEMSVQYQVQAVDHAGNRSAAAGIVVRLPAAPDGTSVPTLVGIALLPVTAVVGLAVGRRHRAARAALTRGRHRCPSGAVSTPAHN